VSEVFYFFKEACSSFFLLLQHGIVEIALDQVASSSGGSPTAAEKRSALSFIDKNRELHFTTVRQPGGGERKIMKLGRMRTNFVACLTSLRSPVL